MSSETKQILTTDGIPLEVSLKKAERKNKIKAFLLVCPLLLFLIITYVFPIGEMFTRSIDDKMAVNIGAHANNRRAFAADVESKA